MMTSEKEEQDRLNETKENLFTIITKKYQNRDLESAKFYCSNFYYLINASSRTFERDLLLISKIYFELREYSLIQKMMEEKVFKTEIPSFKVHKKYNYFNDVTKIHLLEVYIKCLFKLGKSQFLLNIFFSGNDKEFENNINKILATNYIKDKLNFKKKFYFYYAFCNYQNLFIEKASNYFLKVLQIDPNHIKSFKIIYFNYLIPYRKFAEFFQKVYEEFNKKKNTNERNKFDEITYLTYMLTLYSGITNNKFNEYYEIMKKKYKFMINSTSVKTQLIRKLYTDQFYFDCYKEIKSIIKIEKYNCYSDNEVNFIILFINTLFHLKKENELFKLCHELFDIFKDEENFVSYYCSAVYYHLINDNSNAFNFIQHCLELKNNFLEGWILCGHIESSKNAFRDAVKSYRTANILFKYSEIPPYYLTIEYLRLGNIELAMKYVNQSIDICRQNNHINNEIFNEAGVIYYISGDYKKALAFFEKVLSQRVKGKPQAKLDDFWHVVFFNSANCYRKLKNLDKAIKYYKKAIRLSKNQPEYYSSLGFAYHIKGEIDKAIEFYHLSMQYVHAEGPALPSFFFTTFLLRKALGNYSNNFNFDEFLKEYGSKKK